MLKDRTAAELADLLEGMARHPHNTGGLSMLDEATFAFGRHGDDVARAQHAFSAARHAHMRSWDEGRQQYSEEAWQVAMLAAVTLAEALRPLGGVAIARCQRPAGWGTCGLPLDDDGVCRSSLGHTDQED
jgi:hypothetical protein